MTVVVFAVGWSSIELKTEQRVSEHYARQDEASISPEKLHLLCDHLAPRDIAICVINQYEKHEEWDKDRRDLHAQEDMALWAMWMLIFTALALLAIIRTLHHTRRAADYTEDMLVEARDATKAALRTVYNDRAWMIQLASKSARLAGGVIDGQRIENGMRFDVHWQNMGRSPAINARFWSDFSIVAIDDPIPLSVQTKVGKKSVARQLAQIKVSEQALPF